MNDNLNWIHQGETGYIYNYQGETGAYYNSEISHVGSFESISRDIINRIYKQLYKIVENQIYETKSKEFFDLKKQTENDLEKNLNPMDYFTYSLCYFHFCRDKPTTNDVWEYLWLRHKTEICQINLNENSGCVYLSPINFIEAILYIGHSVRHGHCFCSESSNTIFFLDDYHFQQLTLLLHISEPLLKQKLRIRNKAKSNKIGKSILEGKLSDEEITCLDGVVKVSKAFLSSHSSYFLYLFTNDFFKKEEKFSIDFPKKLLESYMIYCCDSEISFETDATIEMIQFGDFVQDKVFLQAYYSEIYKHHDMFTKKSLLEIAKIYDTLDI